MMYKRLMIKIIAIVVAVVFVFSTGFWLGVSFYSLREVAGGTSMSSLLEVTTPRTENPQQEPAISLDLLEEIIDLVVENSIYEAQREDLLGYAIDGMMEGLGDQYAEYFTQEEYTRIMESYGGTMSGIGVVVTQDEQDRVVVIRVIEGTPAHQQGLQENDVIVEVEGEPIQGLSLEKVVSMIRGEAGTTVNLTILRPSDQERFGLDITRERFYVPNLYGEMVQEDVGYIQYIGFQEMGAEKLDQEIEKLIDNGAKGLVLDLRNNLGGILSDAVAVCDVFLDGGTIVMVEGRSGENDRLTTFDAKKGGYTDIPLVVIINGFSASASELAAGALQENDRAILVGETSFGKGTVQTIRELSDGSGFKFTTAQYLLPSGRSIDTIGIIPDVRVEMDLDQEDDLQLEKALEVLEDMIGSNHG